LISVSATLPLRFLFLCDLPNRLSLSSRFLRSTSCTLFRLFCRLFCRRCIFVRPGFRNRVRRFLDRPWKSLGSCPLGLLRCRLHSRLCQRPCRLIHQVSHLIDDRLLLILGKVALAHCVLGLLSVHCPSS